MSQMDEFHKENKNMRLKELEMELRKTIEELQNKNKDLEEQKNKAEKSDKLKSIFLANMSHEIRTPMNSIIGFSSLLMNNGHSKTQTKQYLDIINKNGEQLLKLLSDIIDLSKLEVSELKLDKSEFHISELMGDIYNSFSVNEELKNKKIKFVLDKSFDLNCTLLSDRYRIKQILNNLISNAIKFTDSGTITFGCYFTKTNILKCYVKDTGTGIENKHQKEIFNRFVQVNRNEHYRKEGTGLGLSITKGLIKLLGGNISVKSIKGKGSIFYFTIPIIKTTKIEKENEIIKTKYNFKGIRILIAEDIEDNFDLLYEFLHMTKCDVFWANNGLECINLFKTNRYDIILMDMRMPIMDGYEAIKKIREIDKHIPIIGQTSYALEIDKNKLMELGCSDYLSKPIDKNLLLSTISKYI